MDLLLWPRFLFPHAPVAYCLVLARVRLAVDRHVPELHHPRAGRDAAPGGRDPTTGPGAASGRPRSSRNPAGSSRAAPGTLRPPGMLAPAFGSYRSPGRIRTRGSSPSAVDGTADAPALPCSPRGLPTDPVNRPSRSGKAPDERPAGSPARRRRKQVDLVRFVRPEHLAHRARAKRRGPRKVVPENQPLASPPEVSPRARQGVMTSNDSTVVRAAGNAARGSSLEQLRDRVENQPHQSAHDRSVDPHEL